MKYRVNLSLFLFEYQIKCIVILIFRIKIIIFIYFILNILIILIFIISPITKLNKWQTPFTFMVCFDQTAIYKISNVDIIGPLPVKHNYPSEYHQKNILICESYLTSKTATKMKPLIWHACILIWFF